jgi:hypothetical protein
MSIVNLIYRGLKTYMAGLGLDAFETVCRAGHGKMARIHGQNPTPILRLD